VADLDIINEKLLQNLKRIYDSGYGYHTLRFPNGYVLKGRWDMEKYLKHYQIPEDLNGKTVLDIGPANGFFSFEMFKRGAEVVAIDVNKECWSEDLNNLMSANVKFKIKDLATIDESFGKFDIVFCSNMLQHHPDLVGNIQRIKKITKNMAILCMGVMQDSQFRDNPIARFVGGPGGGGGGKILGFYWKPNMKCFSKIAEFAGFKSVKEISTFEVKHENQIDSFLGVIHCFV